MTVLAQVRKIEAQRKKLGLSMNELCRRAKVSRRMYRYWLAGRFVPKVTTLEKVRKVVEEGEK